MAEIRNEKNEINARIVYWGIAGAGISANLSMIHSKLKQSNRGALRRVPTRIDPTVEYEVLPIELGEVNGVRTRVHVIGVPAGPEQAPTRKQLLDRIDGVVFVADSRPECMSQNAASLIELVDYLGDYGHGPSDLPFVVQYNKCDLVDPFVIERLHREIQVPGAAVYEASAKNGTGILKTLTTISKQVIRHLGRRDDEASARSAHAATPPAVASPEQPMRRPTADVIPEVPKTPPASIPELQAEPIEPRVAPQPRGSGDALSMMESAILAEAVDEAEAQAVSAVTDNAQALLDRPFDALVHEAKPNAGARIGADLRIVSVGDATRKSDRALQVPLVLGNDEGETITLALTIQLDPLLDGDS